MSVFSKLSASKKQAQKLEEDRKQKAKAAGEPKETGPSPGNNRENLREAAERAAERRKSRLSAHSSRLTMSGSYPTHSSSGGINTIGSWEARRAMVQKDQIQICGGPVGIGSARRSYQSSPLASCAPSTAGPSTVSSYEKLEMANLSPAPLRPSIHRRASSLKKSVTIQTPDEEPVPLSPNSQRSFSDQGNDAQLVTVIEPPHKLEDVTVTEFPAELSSEEEKEKVVKKSNKRLSLFWKKRSNQVAVAA